MHHREQSTLVISNPLGSGAKNSRQWKFEKTSVRDNWCKWSESLRVLKLRGKKLKSIEDHSKGAGKKDLAGFGRFWKHNWVFIKTEYIVYGNIDSQTGIR